jgi:hypothetical protein
LAKGIAGLAKAAISTRATAPIGATELTGTIGRASRNAVPLVVASLATGTETAGAAAAIVAALFADAIWRALGSAVSLVTELIGWAAPTDPAAAIITALLAGTIGRAGRGAMTIAVAEGINGAIAAAPPAPVIAALLPGATGSTGLLAVSLLAEEPVSALATTAAAAVIAARLPGTVRLADFLFALSGMAFEARLAFAAGTPASVRAADQAIAFWLAAASILALILLAKLSCWAGAARATAAVATAALAIAIGDTGTTLTAIEGRDVGHALVVPLGITTEDVCVTDTFLYRGVVAAWVLVHFTARARAGAGPAIPGADLAGFTAFTLAIPADRATAPACTAPQGDHFINTDAVPLHLAAEGILVTDAGGHRRIIASGGCMGLTASRPATGTAVAGADEAILVVVTQAITTAAAGAITTVECGDLIDTHLVPGVLAAEGILLTDASLHGGVPTTGPALGLTAGTGASTRPTIIGTIATGLTGNAEPVATVGAADALATGKGLHLRGARIVPGCLATVRIQFADTGLNGRITASESLVGGAAITGPRTVAAILRANGAAFIYVAQPVATQLSVTAVAATKIAHFLCANGVPLCLTAEGVLGANTGCDSRILAAGSAIVLAAIPRATAAILGTGQAIFPDVAKKVATGRLVRTGAATKLGQLGHTGFIPGGVAAVGILSTNALRNQGVIAPWRAIALTAVTGVITATTILGTGGTGFSTVADPVTAHGSRIARTTTKTGHFTDAGIIPEVGAAKGILSADTLGDESIVTTGRAILQAAIPRIVARAAVLGAGSTGFRAIAGTIATHGSHGTVAAPILVHFRHALLIPSVGAAPGVLVTHAVGDEAIVTAGAAVWLAAEPLAFATILGTVGTLLAGIAVAISADRPCAASAAAEILYLVDALLVPGIGAAPGIGGTDAGLHAGLVTAKAAMRYATGRNGQSGRRGE